MIKSNKASSIFALIIIAFPLTSCTNYPAVKIEESELESRRIESNFNIVRSVEFSLNGDLMIITGEAEITQESNSGKVEIWNTTDWELVQTIETEKVYNLGAYFVSDNSKEVVVIDSSKGISLWNTTNGLREKVMLEGLDGENIAMPSDFSAFQQLFSLISSSGALFLLDINTGEGYEVASIDNERYVWKSIIFSEKGDFFAALASPRYTSESNEALQNIIYMFETETKRQISSIEIAPYPVTNIDFVNDHNFVITGVDGFLEIRDFETGEMVRDLSIETPLSYISLASTRIDSMPESTFFAVGSNTATGTYSVVGEITLWSADSSEPLCSTGKMLDTAFVNPAVAISPDGQHLAGVAGGDVIVWDIEQCF